MISCDQRYVPFLAKATGSSPAYGAQCIVSIKPDGEPLAGVVFEGYNQQVILAHIWIAQGTKPEREWLAAIFDYPFNRLRVKKIVGQVKSNNESAMKLDMSFGFKHEATIKDYFEEGVDLNLLTLVREDCRVLNHPRWAKYVELAERAT